MKTYSKLMCALALMAAAAVMFSACATSVNAQTKQTGAKK